MASETKGEPAVPGLTWADFPRSVHETAWRVQNVLSGRCPVPQGAALYQLAQRKSTEDASP